MLQNAALIFYRNEKNKLCPKKHCGVFGMPPTSLMQETYRLVIILDLGRILFLTPFHALLRNIIGGWGGVEGWGWGGGVGDDDEKTVWLGWWCFCARMVVYICARMVVFLC